MKVPPQFWGEAVKTAVHVLNTSPTKSLRGQTPFEAWFRKKPGVKHLRTFGCVAYAKKIGPGVNKLADRSIPGVFLGYEQGTKGYRIYDPVGDKLMVTRDVIFDESRPWNWEGKDSRQGEEDVLPFMVEDHDEVTVHHPTTGDGGQSEAAEAVGDNEADPVSVTMRVILFLLLRQFQV